MSVPTSTGSPAGAERMADLEARVQSLEDQLEGFEAILLEQEVAASSQLEEVVRFYGFFETGLQGVWINERSILGVLWRKLEKFLVETEREPS